MNQPRKVSLLPLLLAASLSLAGCATNRQPVTSAQINPDIADPIRGGRSLVLAARIVPDERTIELLGEFTAEGRAAFEQARSARIANRPRVGMNRISDAEVGAHVATCVLSVVGIVVCPLAVALASAGHGTVNGIRYMKASAREPSLLIPEERAYRLAAMFKEHATGRALAESASRFTIPSPSSNQADPERRILVRMKTVETFESRRNWLGVRMVAEARTLPTSDSAPTDHVYTWLHGPLSGWTEQTDEHLRRALNDALEALAQSIVSTYAGFSPPS